MIVARLASEAGEDTQEASRKRLDRFYAKCDLLERSTPEERQRYQALTEDERGEIGRKLATAGPLSEAVIEERRQGY